MRTVLTVVFTVFILFAPAAKASSIDPAKFKYSAQIQGPVEKNSFYSAVIPPEILNKCFDNCRDLRLSDQGGNEIPFVILRSEALKKKMIYDSEVMSYEEKENSATVVFRLRQNGPVNKTEIVTPDCDFSKQVDLYGSRNGKKWVLISHGRIFDFSSRINLRKTLLDFNSAEYPFYKIHLSDESSGNTGKANIRLKYDGLDFSAESQQRKQIRINAILCRFDSGEKSRGYDSFLFDRLSATIDKAGDSVITIQAGLPFEKIYLEAADPYYFRTVEVSYSDSGEKDSYRHLTDVTIYKFPLFGEDESRDYGEFSSSGHRYYQFRIRNGNNKPLDLKGIRFEWVRLNIGFIAPADAATLKLLFGNPEAQRPDYDLSRFIRQDNWLAHSVIQLQTGPVIENTGYKPPTVKKGREKIEKTVLVAIVIMLIAGMGFWLYSIMKKVSAGTENHPG